jgi:hypothetical protein
MLFLSDSQKFIQSYLEFIMADFSFKPNLDFGASLGPIKTPGDEMQGRWVKKWIANPSASTPLDPGGHWIRVEEPDFDPFTDFGGHGHGTLPNTGGGSGGYSGGGKNRNERDIYIRTPIDRGRGDIPPQELTEEEIRKAKIKNLRNRIRWAKGPRKSKIRKADGTSGVFDYEEFFTPDNCTEEQKDALAALILDILEKLSDLLRKSGASQAAVNCFLAKLESGQIGIGCVPEGNYTGSRTDNPDGTTDLQVRIDGKSGIMGAATSLADYIGEECGNGSFIDRRMLVAFVGSWFNKSNIGLYTPAEGCKEFFKNFPTKSGDGLYKDGIFTFDSKTGKVYVPPSKTPVFRWDCIEKSNP